MKNFVKFMVSPAGRVTRIILGIIIVLIGRFAFVHPMTVIMLIGIIPIAAGIFDFCLVAPLFGYYLSGKKTRAAVNSQPNKTV